MHDPANLDTIVSAVFYGVMLWIAVAVFGGLYLARKYGPRLARKRPLDRLFVDPPK